MCSTNPHPVVPALSLVLLVRSAGPAEATLGTRELEAGPPFRQGAIEFCPMRFVHNREDPTSITNTLVPGGRLHLEALKGTTNVVLRYVVQR